MVRWLCGILFMAFALSWLCLFQADLLDELYQSLMHRWGYDGIVGYGESNIHYYAIPVALALLITLLEIPVARLFRFRDGLYACNYLISALLLGAVTGFEDYNCCMIISGPDTKVWIAIVLVQAFIVNAALIPFEAFKWVSSMFSCTPFGITGWLIVILLAFTMIPVDLLRKTITKSER